MRKTIKHFFTILISSLCLSSCSFLDLIDQFDSLLDNYESEIEYPSYEYSEHEETGYAIKNIDNAFNATISSDNENLRYEINERNLEDEELDSARRLNIEYNLKSLDYMKYSTPSIGKVKGLVIPVDFVNDRAVPYENELLPKYQSVSSYYYNSSYGKLDMSFDVVDWVSLDHEASYYEKYNGNLYQGSVPGVSAIIDEALSKLSSIMDLSIYDSNDDGIIDYLHIIYNHEIDYEKADFWWAYQYYYFENTKYDNVAPYYYIFSGYNFLYEDSDKYLDAHTYIHETGHMLGLEDYYDYAENIGHKGGGLGGADMMDYAVGDHNPFSKMCLGWIKDPILVELNSNKATRITINNYEDFGDTIMICDEFDEEKGIFQDYFLLNLYENDRLFKGEYDEFEIVNPGVRCYRVLGKLMEHVVEENGNSYSYTYFQNDNSYTANNLLDCIRNSASMSGEYQTNKFIMRNTVPTAKSYDFYKRGSFRNYLYYDYNKNIKSSYYFKVINCDNVSATIEISKR